MPLPGGVGRGDHRVEGLAHGEVVRRQDHVDVRIGGQRGNQFGLSAVRADAGEADLAGFLGDLLRFDQFVGTSAGLVLACRYQMSRWSVPSSCRLVSMSASAASLVLAPDLARKRDALALAFQRGAHHALVVAALVDAGGVEIGDADVGGALDHAAHRR